MQYDENAEKYGYEGEMTPIECAELNAYKGDVTIPVYGTIADADVYLKKDVDAAIAELKDKCQMHDFFWEGCGFAKRGFKNTIAVSEAFDRLEAEMEERRWRKFPDEKPKWGEEVLVVDGASKQYIVRFSYDMKWISWGNMNTCESNCVKYWMPLPSSPKETDK